MLDGTRAMPRGIVYLPCMQSSHILYWHPIRFPEPTRSCSRAQSQESPLSVLAVAPKRKLYFSPVLLLLLFLCALKVFSLNICLQVNLSVNKTFLKLYNFHSGIIIAYHNSSMQKQQHVQSVEDYTLGGLEVCFEPHLGNSWLFNQESLLVVLGDYMWYWGLNLGQL